MLGSKRIQSKSVNNHNKQTNIRSRTHQNVLFIISVYSEPPVLETLKCLVMHCDGRSMGKQLHLAEGTGRWRICGMEFANISEVPMPMPFGIDLSTDTEAHM